MTVRRAQIPVRGLAPIVISAATANREWARLRADASSRGGQMMSRVLARYY